MANSGSQPRSTLTPPTAWPGLQRCRCCSRVGCAWLLVRCRTRANCSGRPRRHSFASRPIILIVRCLGTWEDKTFWRFSVGKLRYSQLVSRHPSTARAAKATKGVLQPVTEIPPAASKWAGWANQSKDAWKLEFQPENLDDSSLFHGPLGQIFLGLGYDCSRHQCI